MKQEGWKLSKKSFSIAQIVQVGLSVGELRTPDVMEIFMEPPTWPRWQDEDLLPRLLDAFAKTSVD